MAGSADLERDALFERLFHEFHGAIVNYLYRLIGDAAEAEELAQDVFVRAYQALPRLKGERNYRAWLYRIATHRAYDLLRRRRLVRWLPLGAQEASEPSSPATDAGTRNAVQEALLRLSPEYRVPLILYSVQGYSTAEIAEMLGISVGAVKTRLYRAREAFRRMYQGDESDGL
ncbi:MAG: RNA polymerase sigma factor [Chloroflexi bacterium]|nr:RNA polymerase sigma factor [Chloroflexota bacterium]